MSIEGFDLLTSLDEYVEMERVAPNGFTTPRIPLKWKCHRCGNVFAQYMYLYGREPRCLKCNPLLYNKVDSNEEIDLFNFVASIDGSKYDCFRHSYWNWNLLSNGKLIDIVCISKDTEKPAIAFEFNGLYWHSVMNKDLGYHLMKTKLCEDTGVKLIHIWEDEWLSKKDELKDFLQKVMRDDYHVSTAEDTVVLDRSRLCKLWVPNGFTIVGETRPEIHVHMLEDAKRYPIEDCGKLVCRRM